MRIKVAVVLFVALLVFQPLLTSDVFVGAQTQSSDIKTPLDLYVGVDVAYEDLAATKQLIDTVSSYTNLFVVGCLGDRNETRLTSISQYVYDKNMSFIVYTDDPRYPSKEWFNLARSQWGNSFLGLYVADETGGRQLDQSEIFMSVRSAENYSDAANKYINYTSWWLQGAFKINFEHPNEFQMFTSDYALYWYDYKAGYDAVFAEFGWNYSRQINVALCRGAAAAQNREWGAMITWTYLQSPYIESGPELFNDMVTAYESGAKYIIVFDTNENYTASILQQEHFDAMQQFWQYVQENPRTISPVSERTAYVLPEDYAYGFRGPEDKIWGLWEADAVATDISMSVSSLLQVCGNDLDIIYPDQQYPLDSLGYGTVVHWDDSRLIPPDWPQVPITPSPTPMPTATPQPTSTPNHSPSSSPTKQPTTTPSPSEQPTPTTKPATDSMTPLNYLYATIVGVIVATVVGLVFVRKKRLNPSFKVV
jgi:hypothetical protein